jgi:hypothetical protein
VATFAFAPTDPEKAALNIAELPDTFRHLVNVTIGIATAEVEVALVNLVIDGLIHCDHS